jgi:hypothetical protein
MRRQGIFGIVTVLVATLAGCSMPDVADLAQAREDAPPSMRTAAVPEPVTAPPPAATPEGPSLALALSEPWVKPRNAVEAVADVAAGAEVLWFIESNTTAVGFTEIAGTFYLRGGETSAEPSRARHATGLLAPGTGSSLVRLAEEGRFVFAAPRHPATLLVVETDARAETETAQVTLVRDEFGFRFHPPRVVMTPGGAVTFLNGDTLPHSVAERALLLRLPSTAPRIALVGVDTGWYGVSAVVHGAAGGESVARAPLLVDFETPALRMPVGPFSAEPELVPQGAPRRHAMQAVHPVRELRLDLVLDDDAPLGASATLRLRDAGGGLVHETATEETTRVMLGSLAAGDYTLEVERHGPQPQAYRLTGELHYAPAPPPVPPWLQAAP